MDLVAPEPNRTKLPDRDQTVLTLRGPENLPVQSHGTRLCRRGVTLIEPATELRQKCRESIASSLRGEGYGEVGEVSRLKVR